MIFENLTKIQLGLLLFFHVALGIVSSLVPGIIEVWYFGILGISFFIMIGNQNKNEIASLVMAYYTGIEIVLRMTNAKVPWEGVKYILVLFSFLAIAIEKVKKSESSSIINAYFLLLLPSILVVNFQNFGELRNSFSFNLSGPLSILMATRYFYNRQFSLNQLKTLFIFLILPMLSTCAIIAFRVPTFSEIKFQDAANFELSGGYGPNQVSSLLGFGVVVMMSAYFLNLVVFINKNVDRIITFVLFLFCIINFSRGGVVTAIISIFLGAIIWFMFSNSDKKNRFIFTFAVIAIITFFIFTFFDNLTGNSLSKRYAGTFSKKDPKYENYGSGLSGREDIFQEDIELFLRYPVLGVGPGMSPKVRGELFDDFLPSHTEFTRLISEHGILGLFSLFILLALPVSIIAKSKEFYRKLFLIMFASFSIICSFHAAMRIAMMGFAYGVSFINLVKKRDDLADPVKDYQEKSMLWQQYEQRQ